MIKIQGNISKRIEQDLKNIAEFDGQSIEVGWFDEQGIHTPSGMKYTDLAHYHATGGGGTVIHRDVLAVLDAMYPFDEDVMLGKLILEWACNPTKINSNKITKYVGITWKERLQDLFGSEYLSPTENNPDPLIDTGELRESVTCKTYKEK